VFVECTRVQLVVDVTPHVLLVEIQLLLLVMRDRGFTAVANAAPVQIIVSLGQSVEVKASEQLFPCRSYL